MSPANTERVLASVRKWGDAGTFPKIAATLGVAVPPRTLKRWLTQLVRDGRLVRRGGSIATRYSVAELPNGNGAGPVGPMPPVVSSPSGARVAFGRKGGVRERSQMPWSGRASVSYQRSVLDAYRPNETAYLAESLRARLSQRLSPQASLQRPPSGSALSPEWQRFVAELAVWSREADVALGFAARRHRRVMAPNIVAGVVARSDVPSMAGDLRRIWNHRDAVALLAATSRGARLTLETVAALQSALTRPASAASGAVAAAVAPVAPPTNPICRTISLLLAGTTYRPASDPVLIEGALRQIVFTADEISDPVEASLFVLAHVLLLLPFDAENLSLAVLLANIPLVAAGLEPVLFTSVPLSDLRPAVLAWWERADGSLLAAAWSRGPVPPPRPTAVKR